MKENKKEVGLRYNQGKNMLDLLPPNAIEQFGNVMTYGATKYSRDNWKNGLSWTSVIASLKRHLLAIEKGIDFDEETGLLHSAHVMTNAAFLTEYYYIYPSGDDRYKPYFDKRVALDIDSVLCNFEKAFCDRYGLESRNNHWHFSYFYKKHREEIQHDKDFWLNMESVVDAKNLPFEPIAYVSNRSIPESWTMEWLEKNGFPCEPVYSCKDSKADVLKNIGAELFVEDNFHNFVDLRKNGIACYLISRPYNLKFDVGHFRIEKLEDLLKLK